ncbi:MAG: hypothetical protein HY824_05150 [Acidobacteria bacterium]|nr:hypothetical protein [Acidobacteriota bacterium]
MKVLILTSTFLRHQYLANRAAERLDLVGVWQERKSFEPLRYAETPDDEAEIQRHFAARDASEAEWFGADADLRLPPACVHHSVASGGCNTPDEIAAMVATRPDVVTVFGTGILSAAVIDAFPGRILNLHLGLSPYYRGAGTNFWPLVNREPEYVGATIHYLDAGIDTGPIVAHARPDVRADDGPHDLGNRAIVAAVDVLLQAARRAAVRPLPSMPQQGGGRLYQRKDFSAAAVRRLDRNVATGMLAEYLDDRARRDARLALVSLPEEPVTLRQA